MAGSRKNAQTNGCVCVWWCSQRPHGRVALQRPSCSFLTFIPLGAITRHGRGRPRHLDYRAGLYLHKGGRLRACKPAVALLDYKLRLPHLHHCSTLATSSNSLWSSLRQEEKVLRDILSRLGPLPKSGICRTQIFLMCIPMERRCL